MATVKKLPSGNWNAIGYYKDPISGKVSRPSFTAPSKSEAVRMAAEWEENKRRSALPSELTVKECIERFITVKEAALSPATIRGYRRMQRCNYSYIENITIKNLTDEDMQGFVSVLCKDLSPKSVRNVYALLTASLNMFTDRRFRVTLPKKRPVELHIPTDDDVRNLMASATPSLRLAIALAAIGTLRAGEICALTYSCVDYENNTIHVYSDMVKNTVNEWVIKDMPKTSSSDRFIPIPEQLMEMIGHGDPEELIYGRTPAAINRSFDRLRDSLGLKCRFHDLRHYAASIMHAIGVPDQYIMERGGWKTDTVLKSVYRNTLSDQSKKYAEISLAHFSGLF